MSPPSSRVPAGVPSSGGNAKYAIVAVVLLLAAGGLFAWRSCMTNRDQVAAPPPPSVSAAALDRPPPNPHLDDVPPPPPPEEKPEGGAVGGGGSRTVYVAAGGCEAKCTGTAPPELGQSLQVRAAQARRCYNSALASDSTLKGHVTIAVKVGPSGNVCGVSVAGNDMGSPNVANCAANIFRSVGSYPAPRGGCVDATVPMSFVPQGQ
jgi:hypothetical protein